MQTSAPRAPTRKAAGTIIAIVLCILVVVLALIVAFAMRHSAASRAATPRVGGDTADSSDDESDDIECGGAKASVDSTRFSTLRPHQARSVKAILKKHFCSPKHIIDATAHVGGDSIHFLEMYPAASLTSVEIDPRTFEALQTNVTDAVKRLRRDPNTVRLINGNGVDFLRSTDEKADFVYLDPPWGGPDYAKQKSMPLSLSDSAGKKWDASEVANLVFQRGIASHVVLKAPFNYRTAEFSSRLDVPISVHPVGRSLARHSSVSYYLIVAGEGVMKGGY